MLILTIRTDKPEAEIGLYNDTEQLGYIAWQAHRQLAESIHQKIADLLESKNHSIDQLEGITIYKGPGSFTGLRIGFSVANALAGSLKAPVVSSSGESWILTAIDKLRNGCNEQVAIPEYGSPPHITKPKH